VRGVYIPHFDHIPVKTSVLGSYTLTVAPMGVKSHRCNVSPLRGEKPQNRPLSNLNNRRFALRAMLPVNEHDKHKHKEPSITTGHRKSWKTKTLFQKNHGIILSRLFRPRKSGI